MDDPLAKIKAKQLWLFPPTKPFNEHFGREYFGTIPREPGVYFFFDADGLLLYIGKAKSLRTRINSYRYVHPDRDSRKSWRLVNAVHRIDWIVCESHQDALLHESRLLRTHRPKFNRANVWPWSAVYIGLGKTGDAVTLTVSRELTEGFEWFGAFKAFSIYAFNALHRTLHYLTDPHHVPFGWYEWDAVRSFTVHAEQIPVASLRDFLRGHSDSFLREMEATRASDGGVLGLAEQNLILNDLILLEHFYEKGPHRNRRIRNNGELVTPEELVDWLAVQSDGCPETPVP